MTIFELANDELNRMNIPFQRPEDNELAFFAESFNPERYGVRYERCVELAAYYRREHEYGHRLGGNLTDLRAGLLGVHRERARSYDVFSAIGNPGSSSTGLMRALVKAIYDCV